MTTKKFLAASSSLLASLAVFQTAHAQWISADIGGPGYAGSTVSNPDGTLTISGSGADIWGNSDQFFYYYQSVTGLSWDAVMRVRNLQGPDWWSKVELMVRQPATAGGPPAADD